MAEGTGGEIVTFELACIVGALVLIAYLIWHVVMELKMISVCLEEIGKLRVLAEIMLERSVKNGH